MAVFHETIPEKLIRWCLLQHMFWVATAPLAGSGHVNISPKGGPYFGIPDEKTFWYVDLTGSGIETITHLYEPGNGRITVQFNAFDGPPQIIRFWGKGRVLENGTQEFEDWVQQFNIEMIPGIRSIIVVDVHQVCSSCGFSVPFYDFKEYRPVLNDFWARKEKRYLEGKKDESMDRYWAHKNAFSIDGLPGMKRGLKAGKTEQVTPIKKMVGSFAPKNGSEYAVYDLQHLLFVAVLSFLLGIAFIRLGPRLAMSFGGEIARLSSSMSSPGP